MRGMQCEADAVQGGCSLPQLAPSHSQVRTELLRMVADREAWSVDTENSETSCQCCLWAQEGSRQCGWLSSHSDSPEAL